MDTIIIVVVVLIIVMVMVMTFFNPLKTMIDTCAITFSLFKYTFYNCIVLMGFLQREIRAAFPGESQLQRLEWRYPTYGACRVLQCLHSPPNSFMDYGIFNVRTDVNACDCAQGCTDTVRESALKVDPGSSTRESNLRQRRAGLMLYQPVHIPTPY